MRRATWARLAACSLVAALGGCEASSVRLYGTHEAIDPSAELKLIIPDIAAMVPSTRGDLSYGVPAIGSAVEATFWHGYGFDGRDCDTAVYRRLGTRTHKLAHLHRTEEDEPPDLLLPSEIVVKVPPGQVNIWFKYQIGTENRSQFSRTGWFGGSFVAEVDANYEMRLVYANVMLDPEAKVFRRHAIARDEAIKQAGFELQASRDGARVEVYTSVGEELKAGEAAATFTSACARWMGG